jgi:arylformamidase
MEFTQIIDITYPIEEGMPTFGADWHTKVCVRQKGNIDHVGRETRELLMGSHTGTHIDAPRHFIPDGMTIDCVLLKQLCGSTQIIDVSFLKHNGLLTEKILRNFEISPRIIFYFGWGKEWTTGNFYKNYPFFTVDAANFLIEKGIRLIGMDTPSPDDSRTKLGSPEDSVIHKLFLKNGVILTEYLANLDIVDTSFQWTLMALPLKIKHGDGSPARICLVR